VPEGKLPPHDTDAEESVNGSLLIDGTAIYKTAAFLKPADFYSEANQWIYGACLALYQRGEGINQITIAQELDRLGKLESTGGAAYLSHLIAICPTSLDIEHYGQIVYRLAMMRRLIAAAGQIETIGYEANPDIDTSLNRAESLLFRLRHGQGGRDFVHIREVLDKYLESTAPGGETESETKGLPYVLSGFIGLDEMLNGLQRSDLIIIAGRPSMGKTSLALNIARNAAVEQGATVAIFSMEMSRQSLVLRMVSSESGINLKKVRFGLHGEDSPGIKVVEIRSKARRLQFERGIDLIVLDYLQLMGGEGMGENRVQEISFISRSLKAIARELNVPVVALSQLSRNVDWRPNHHPQLSDLRESGSIEQDADIVLFIYRDEVYFNSNQVEWETAHPGENYPPPVELIIAKHRNGPTGVVNLHFKGSLAKFENIAGEEPGLL
jgi:replicative DNA helicase